VDCGLWIVDCGLWIVDCGLAEMQGAGGVGICSRGDTKRNWSTANIGKSTLRCRPFVAAASRKRMTK
jgi:hypothetical protein